jgi:hypothetical protein
MAAGEAIRRLTPRPFALNLYGDHGGRGGSAGGERRRIRLRLGVRGRRPSRQLPPTAGRVVDGNAGAGATDRGRGEGAGDRRRRHRRRARDRPGAGARRRGRPARHRVPHDPGIRRRSLAPRRPRRPPPRTADRVDPRLLWPLGPSDLKPLRRDGAARGWSERAADLPARRPRSSPWPAGSMARQARVMRPHTRATRGRRDPSQPAEPCPSPRCRRDDWPSPISRMPRRATRPAG